MTPRWSLEASGRPRAPGGPAPFYFRGLGAIRAPFGVAPGGAGTLRGGLWDPPGRLLDVPEGVFVIPNGVPKKVTTKCPILNFGDQFSASRKCYQNFFSMSFLNTRVFECDM